MIDILISWLRATSLYYWPHSSFGSLYLLPGQPGGTFGHILQISVLESLQNDLLKRLKLEKAWITKMKNGPGKLLNGNEGLDTLFL